MTALWVSVILYVTVMLAVGIQCFSKVHTLNDFCIGARQITPAETGLSGQVSELGFFIFIMIPAEVYLLGLGKAWVIVGLFTGTVLIWYLMSYRMMRYSLIYQNVYTFPDYLERRFGRGDFLPVLAAVLNIIFDIVAASALTVFLSGIVSDILGINPKLISVAVLLLAAGFVMLSGYKGMVKLEKINAGIIVAALLALPVVILFIFKADELIIAIMNSRVVGGVSSYLNLFRTGGASIRAEDIINQISWGFVIMGLPGLMVCFLSIGKAKTAKNGGRFAILYTLLTLFFTVVCGVLYRAFLYPVILKNGNNHLFISTAVTKLSNMETGYKVAGGVIFAGLFAVSFSMIISELHNACSVIYCSLIRTRILRKYRIRKNLKALRIILPFVCMAAFALTLIGIDPIKIIESAFICIGASFGPCAMLSLYYRRMNTYGAISGIISGAVVSFGWRFLELFKVNGEFSNLETITGLNPIIPSFLVSAVLILLVSAVTPDVNDKIKKDYDDVRNRII